MDQIPIVLSIRKKYVTDKRRRRVGVTLRIEDFERMSEVIENYGLYHWMKEVGDEKPLTLQEAKTYYRKLKKAP